jgi:hypothetical protein
MEIFATVMYCFIGETKFIQSDECTYWDAYGSRKGIYIDMLKREAHEVFKVVFEHGQMCPQGPVTPYLRRVPRQPDRDAQRCKCTFPVSGL